MELGLEDGIELGFKNGMKLSVSDGANLDSNGRMGFDLDISCTIDGRECQYFVHYRVKSDPSKDTTQDPTSPIGLISMISAFKADRQWIHQHFIYCDNSTPRDWSATCKSNAISMTPDFYTTDHSTLYLIHGKGDESCNSGIQNWSLQTAHSALNLILSKGHESYNSRI
eukprot:10557038-Ditylum_brightwellii.AAC.1